ncbi:MAG: nucleoside kinase [Treponema sp.]|jgi:uridine kinase|nr:nucleoside kinase [Treponema sp.]
MDDIQIHLPNGVSLRCPFATQAETLVEHFGEIKGGLAGVKVNNEIRPMSTSIEVNASLEPVPLESPEGAMIYRRSLSFLLAIAARDLFPQRGLYVGHSLGNSYYYTFGDGEAPSANEVASLKARMQALVEEDLPIVFHYMSYTEALAMFEKNGQTGTAQLLEERNDSRIKINECRGFADLYVEPLVPRTGLLRVFDLMVYSSGFLLLFPGVGKDKLEPFSGSSTIFAVYNEYKEWGLTIGTRTVGDLNRLIRERAIREYIRIAESFQAKKIAYIADKVCEKQDTVKVVLIAGPSSSGKTTTAKRLSLELKVMGMKPIPVSLDDYYVNTDQTPRDEKGEPDYECLEALDVSYFNQQLLALFNGDEVTLPEYDFKTGRRRETGGRQIRLGKRSILIVEGIHGLNDALTLQIPRNTKFKLYVSALTQLNLDDHNRIPTSDNRLLRRIVRDAQFRSTGTVSTIKMWPSVRRGERLHIFPFQDSADIAFNSALSYELAVLKFYAEPLLRSVKPGYPEYTEAVRLRSFLENFAPIPPQYVPGHSILREFIGDSDFKY